MDSASVSALLGEEGLCPPLMACGRHAVGFCLCIQNHPLQRLTAFECACTVK